jgi:3D (Asp-Asp-Asp) domain-containing protein
MRNCSQIVSIGLLCLAFATTASAAKQDNSKNGEIRVEKKSIQPTVTYRFDRSVGRGRLVKAHDGAPGTVKRTYKVVYKNGKAVDTVLVKEELTQARNTTFLMGKEGYPTSRGSWTRTRTLEMVATAYTNSPSENGGYTIAANGTPLVDGVVAVDPRVIPIGSKLYVEGYGFAYAADTGGAIKGNRIDLLFPSVSSSNVWGRRRVKVHVLSGRS